MDGGLRVDVMEGESVVVLVDDLGGDLLGYDFVEDGGLREIDGRVGALLCGHGGMRSGRVGEWGVVGVGRMDRGEVGERGFGSAEEKTCCVVNEGHVDREQEMHGEWE